MDADFLYLASIGAAFACFGLIWLLGDDGEGWPGRIPELIACAALVLIFADNVRIYGDGLQSHLERHCPFVPWDDEKTSLFAEFAHSAWREPLGIPEGEIGAWCAMFWQKGEKGKR